MAIEYYSRAEAGGFAYYRIPKLLFSDQRYRSMSTDAKVLYGLLLDRLSLSQKNGWFDDQDRAYVYYRREQIESDLQIGHTRATQLLRELEDHDLIARRRQGLGMPTMIYIGRFTPSPPASIQSADLRTNEGTEATRGPLDGPPDDRHADHHYMKKETERNYTESSSGGDAPPARPSPTKKMRTRDDYRSFFASRLGASVLAQQRPQDEVQIHAAVNLLASVFVSHHSTIRISGNDVPISDAREQLLSLRQSDLEHVLDMVSGRQIVNARAYLLAALYNAPLASAIADHKQPAADLDRNAWMDEYV